MPNHIMIRIHPITPRDIWEQIGGTTLKFRIYEELCRIEAMTPHQGTYNHVHYGLYSIYNEDPHMTLLNKIKLSATLPRAVFRTLVLGNSNCIWYKDIPIPLLHTSHGNFDPASENLRFFEQVAIEYLGIKVKVKSAYETDS